MCGLLSSKEANNLRRLKCIADCRLDCLEMGKRELGILIKDAVLKVDLTNCIEPISSTSVILPEVSLERYLLKSSSCSIVSRLVSSYSSASRSFLKDVCVCFNEKLEPF